MTPEETARQNARVTAIDGQQRRVRYPTTDFKHLQAVAARLRDDIRDEAVRWSFDDPNRYVMIWAHGPGSGGNEDFELATSRYKDRLY